MGMPFVPLEKSTQDGEGMEWLTIPAGAGAGAASFITHIHLPRRQQWRRQVWA